jgi:hypothetical protein
LDADGSEVPRLTRCQLARTEALARVAVDLDHQRVHAREEALDRDAPGGRGPVVAWMALAISCMRAVPASASITVRIVYAA